MRSMLVAAFIAIGSPAAAGDLDRLFEQAIGGEFNKPAHREPQVLVFVSLSMPTASLVRLARDAHRAGATVFLRGFKDDSLAKTREALLPILREVNPAPAIQIHPNAFSTYGVTTVPTVVLTRSTASAESMPYAAVVGDVSLRYALEHLSRTAGEFAPIARERAERLQFIGRAH